MKPVETLLLGSILFCTLANVFYAVLLNRVLQGIKIFSSTFKKPPPSNMMRLEIVARLEHQRNNIFFFIVITSINLVVALIVLLLIQHKIF
jgi:hypothetical protein